MQLAVALKALQDKAYGHQRIHLFHSWRVPYRPDIDNDLDDLESMERDFISLQVRGRQLQLLKLCQCQCQWQWQCRRTCAQLVTSS